MVPLSLAFVASACAPQPDLERGTPQLAQGPQPRLLMTIEVGQIHALAVGEDGVWTANYEDGTVSLVDPSKDAVAKTIPVRGELGSGASDIFAIDDHVWLSASDTETIGHLDPSTSEVTFAADTGPAGTVDMAVTSDELWLAQHSGTGDTELVTTHGFEMRSANREVPPPGERFSIYSDIAAGDIGVWAIDESEGTLAAISPTQGEPRVVVTNDDDVRGGQATVAVGLGYVWVETSSGGPTRIARFDPSGSAVESVSVEGQDGVLAVGTGALWLLTHNDNQGLLYKIDPQTMAVSPPLFLDGRFQLAAMAYGFGSLWISHGTNLLSRVDVTGDALASESPPAPERRGDAEVCEQRGRWVDCPQSRWLRRVVVAADLEVTGDTGSALEVSAASRRLYAWNTLADKPVEEVAEEEGYEWSDSGVYSDGQRLLWEALGLHIYVSSADQGSVDELPESVIQELVAASREVPMEADLSGAKPQPMPTADQRFEDAPGNKVRVWPVTEDVPNEGKYLFTAPHCGLDWMLDFDGSFWDALEPDDYGNGENYSFFYNSDEGAITFAGDDVATYQASTGERIRLVRLKGPIEIDPCA